MTQALYSETSGSEHAGQAETLVLLHGWGTNLRVFDPLRAALAEQQPVTAIDLPGHGRSSWISRQSPRAQLERVAALVPRGASLVGWSLGGQLALQLAAEPALGVRRLVLLASSPRFVSSDDWPHGMEPAVMRHFAAQLQRDPAGTVADFLQLLVRGSAGADAALAALQSALAQAGPLQPEALAASLGLLEHNDLRQLARGIDVPTLLIAGQYDRVTPAAASWALARMLPRARCLELKRAGHAPFLSHPREVIAAVRAFLQPAMRPTPPGAVLAP